MYLWCRLGRDLTTARLLPAAKALGMVFASGEDLVTAAGLHASRLDGSPLRYNRPDPYLPDFVMCRPELAGTLLDAIGSLF